VHRVFTKSRAQRRASFHIGAHVVQQFSHAAVRVATAHNVKRLQQRHTGFHHGGKLAGKNGNVFRFDGLARTHAALFNFGCQNTLPAQRHLDLVFSTRAKFAANLFSAPVLAFPFEDKFLGIFGQCSRHIALLLCGRFSRRHGAATRHACQGAPATRCARHWCNPKPLPWRSCPA